ncbi:Mur ligase family protein [Spiroplasma endosymbiont of Aspidapion aeneum]|uniref:Mur ligase family protein n=1 Tax=Spiroplasma endosymbiont of Aspidapion aeneum TaxID=3066276 RepID=UPI00313EFE22
MISNEIEIVNFQNKLSKNFSLSKLLSEIGNPQNSIQVINIVGTNGKGSVSNALHQCLQKIYKNVGLFTSPSFLYHNERFKINNKYISDSELNSILKEYDYLIRKYNLTFFEIFTLVTIIYFCAHKIDIAIIEAGIGGVLDSTSVFKNQKLVVVTSISYDHQEILGKHIRSIINQKISIANKGVPIYISADNLKYRKYIQKNYEQTIFCENSNTDLFYNNGNIGLVNRISKDLKISINPNEINRPIGRFTYIQRNPDIIIDGCHNIDGIKKAIKSLPNKSFNFLFASSKNKNISYLKFLKKHCENLYICEFEHFKSWKIPDKIKKKSAFIYDWKKFLKENKDCNLFIFGSLYFIPYIYKYYKKST